MPGPSNMPDPQPERSGPRTNEREIIRDTPACNLYRLRDDLRSGAVHRIRRYIERIEVRRTESAGWTTSSYTIENFTSSARGPDARFGWNYPLAGTAKFSALRR